MQHGLPHIGAHLPNDKCICSATEDGSKHVRNLSADPLKGYLKYFSCGRYVPSTAIRRNMEFPPAFLTCNQGQLTYLPHKAVAEVSKDKEPIGRVCAELIWFESQLMSDSNEVRFK